MTVSALSTKISSGRSKQRQVASRSTTRLVTFSAGSEVFGIDVSRVREIVEVLRIRVVPQAPAFLEGVIDVRGHVIPAVDLVKRLGMPSEGAPKGPGPRKAVLAEVGALVRTGPEAPRSGTVPAGGMGDQTVALLVDQVFHVVRVASEDVELPPAGILRPGAEALVTGIARASEEVIFVLHLEALFSSDEATAMTRASVGGALYG